MCKSKLLNVSAKILCITVFAFVFSFMIIFFHLVRSILITDSSEETPYEEIDQESKINFQDYLQRVTEDKNDISGKDILFVNGNDSYDINDSGTDAILQ